MLVASTNFQRMIEGSMHRVYERVEIDLPSAYNTDVTQDLVSMSIAASMTTDMPDGTRFESGDSTMTADVVVAGSIVAQLATYPPTHLPPIVKSPVRIFIGLYPDGAGGVPEVLQKFDGYIDTYTEDPANGEITFNCLGDTLRSIPSLPGIVTAPPYNSGLTSEFVIDSLLRTATNGAVSSWPAQRSSSVFAAGFRSSLWPEVGALDTTQSQPNPLFLPGVGGSGLAGTSGFFTGNGGPLYQVGGRPLANDVFMEAFLTGGTGTWMAQLGMEPAVRSDGNVTAIQLYIFSDSLVLSFNGTAVTTISTTINGGPHYVAAHLHYNLTGAVGSTSGTVTGTLYLDNQTFAVNAATSSTVKIDYPSTMNYVGVVASKVVVSGVQISGETTPALNNAFVPGAVLDPSLNTLQVIPALDPGSDPMQVIQQIAEAELGFAGFLENGAFRFTNRDTLKTSGSVRTLTSSNSLQSLQIENSLASVVTRVQVEVSPWIFGTAGFVWSADTVVVVPAHGTTVLTPTTDSLIAAVNGVAVTRPASGASTAQTYFRASSDRYGTTQNTSVSMKVVQTSSNQLRIVLTNTGAVTAYMVSSANFSDVAVGSPLIQVSGIPITADSTNTVDVQYPPLNVDGTGGAVSGTYGEIAYQVSGNPWIQDNNAATALAQTFLYDMCEPRPQLTNISIIPDPRLQLGDRVRLVDPVMSGVDEYAVIWGSNFTDDGNDWEMTVDARTVAKPGGWILGVPGRSELGATTWI